MDPQTLKALILSQTPPPTDQQLDAIFSNDLEYLLRAAPGSGKTWTACRRFIWRAVNWQYEVGGLALLSFTNVAVREFQDPTSKLGQANLLRDPNYLGTFDAFVERFILTPFGHLVAGVQKRPVLFRSPRPGDRKNGKLQCWIDVNGKKMPVYAWEIVPVVESGKVIFRTSGERGGKQLDTTNAKQAFLEFLKLGFYTHAQRGFLANHLLSKRPHITARLSKRFPEIIVDEAQDTNVWLLHLLRKLRKEGTQVTLVGDPDQCIYSFAMADAASLFSLRQEWQILEKPLSKSFRCNDQIAIAVKSMGSNAEFAGCGDPGSEAKRSFILRETTSSFQDGIGAFSQMLANAGIGLAKSAIICRANDDLKSVRGQVNYINLSGKTKRLAESAFFRDYRKDYKAAFDGVEEVLRELIWDDKAWDALDDAPDSKHAEKFRETLWRFVKNQHGLPPVSLNGQVWITTMKDRLATLISDLGVSPVPSLGKTIQKRGLEDSQLALPLFEEQKLFPNIRHDTIHQVKGESIDAVLVIGSAKFWNSVVSAVTAGENNEERRLAYVAMTRARHLLVLCLPKNHYDKCSEQWKNWGFAAANFEK
jgi:hypothetical protein